MTNWGSDQSITTYLNTLRPQTWATDYMQMSIKWDSGRSCDKHPIQQHSSLILFAHCSKTLITTTTCVSNKLVLCNINNNKREPKHFKYCTQPAVNTPSSTAQNTRWATNKPATLFSTSCLVFLIHFLYFLYHWNQEWILCDYLYFTYLMTS